MELVELLDSFTTVCLVLVVDVSVLGADGDVGGAVISGAGTAGPGIDDIVFVEVTYHRRSLR